MKLKGKNLGERQHDLNTKVNEAISQKINFAAIRDDPVDTDIDQLFKIDIASRLKDVAFLLQTLMSGDSLHITRALKSVWLFDNEYQLIMNPLYLSENVFPHMSSKMMKKLLTTASIWIKNEERAEKFYLYCKENGMENMAVKFLVSTTEAFKETALQDDCEVVSNIEDTKLQFIIGSSFKLADLYIRKSYGCNPNGVLNLLRFLYFEDSDQYLEMLETYYVTDSYYSYRFGLRISKHIIKKYKERILKHPRIYFAVLNKSIIAQYSNSDDAKLFLKEMLPAESHEFWSNFMSSLEFVINIIPLGNRFEFVKKIYDDKYKSAIEMNSEFYQCRYYKHMTEAQQEKWALDQLASKKELLGSGLDFLWYKFVRFELSFEEIKKLILITKNDNKRIYMLCVLVECAKNQSELEKLLNYFYTKHVNETKDKKYEFLDCVTANHNIFSLTEHRWNAFNKILYSLDVYNAQNIHVKTEYRIISFFYHILHGKDLPEDLRLSLIFMGKLEYIPSGLELKIKQYDQKGPELIYKYILKMYLDELVNLEKQECNDKLKMKARNIINLIERLRSMFHKTDHLPEIVTKFKKLDAETFSTNPRFKPVTPQEFVRLLKKDASLVTDFDLLERNIEYTGKYNIKMLLQKLQIYFLGDTAQQYLDYFKKAYSKEGCNIIYASVFGILVLADKKFKKEFILQHIPEDSKVQHDEINRNLLYIREAICRFAFYSRPSIEIDTILPYIKGDYLKYCLPMFNVYLTQYPPALRDKFVKSLVSKPVSIQKHGIRLAFQCFKTNEWIDLILNSWKNYRNISLRMVIYKYVFRKVQICEATRKEMFEILKKITIDLKEDECEDVMKIAMQFRDLPSAFQGFYLDALWTVISKFSDSQINIKAKADIISKARKDLPKETVKKIVSEHVNNMLVNNKILPEKERRKYENYDEAAWALTHAFICKYCRDEDILKLIKCIIKKCVEKWNDTHFDYKCNEHVFVFQRFCSDFINSLIDESCYFCTTDESNCILESVLNYLTDSLPKHEIFVLMLNIKVVVLSNRVLEYARVTYDGCEIGDKEAEDIAREYFKELEKLAKEMFQSKLYITPFLDILSELIVNNVLNVHRGLPGGTYGDTVRYEKLLILIASNLADSSLLEIVPLAVAIMPDFCSDGEWKNYSILLDKLAKTDNDNVKYLMNVKSAKNKYKVKRRKI